MSDNRTSVWYLITALPVGGTERTLVNLVNGLDTRRFDPTIWTVFDRNPLADELDDVRHRTLGVETATRIDDPYHYRASDPTEYVRAPLRFLRAVRSEQPDVLQSFLFVGNLIARAAGVVSPQTTVINGVRAVPTDPNPVKSSVDTATIRAADAIVSNSAAGAAFAVERGAPSNRVTVIRNGRRLDEYRNAPPVDLNAELGVPEDARIVGSVGRLVERKGHHDLIAAWPRIRSRHPNARLLLVGDGPQRETLRRQADRLDRSKTIHFVGVRDDVPGLLASMDVFVFPSHFEGLPGAVQEAMAAGLPVIAADATGTDELITDGETGLLVPVGDSRRLANAVTSLLDDPSLARSIGHAASRTANDRFPIERMVREFERLYEGEEPSDTGETDYGPRQHAVR